MVNHIESAINNLKIKRIDMSKNKNNVNPIGGDTKKGEDDNQEGYPRYSKSEDIYEKSKEESDVNPADITKTKSSLDTNDLRQQVLDKKHSLTGKDLDVPGSELDDEQEATGNEDEENNYYSLGDDNI